MKFHVKKTMTSSHYYVIFNKNFAKDVSCFINSDVTNDLKSLISSGPPLICSLLFPLSQLPRTDQSVAEIELNKQIDILGLNKISEFIPSSFLPVFGDILTSSPFKTDKMEPSSSQNDLLSSTVEQRATHVYRTMVKFINSHKNVKIELHCLVYSFIRRR